MRCPYLSRRESRYICVLIEKKKKPLIEKTGLADVAEVSEFDYVHYCNGNPIYCYYYRNAENRK
jgi:hypothetical protein